MPSTLNDNCVAFFIVFSSLISFIMLIINISSFDLEDLYTEAIIQTWYDNYPILNISIHKNNDDYEEIEMLKIENTFCDCTHVDGYKDAFSDDKKFCTDEKFKKGCLQYDSSKKASKFYNKTLYVSYYKTDYWTLHDRIYIDKNGYKKCKDIKGVNYYKCGYLDSFDNPLCIIEGKESCPVTNFGLRFDNNNNLIDIRNRRYETNTTIINKIYASEIKNATLFDMHKILTSANKSQEKRKGEEYFTLFSFYKEIDKSLFYRHNNLTNEPFPGWFQGKKIYFYYLTYPGNLINYPITKTDIIFFKKPVRLTLRFLILFFKICLLIIIKIKIIKNKFVDNKIIFIGGFIILTSILYSTLIILNIISFSGKRCISQNVYYYLSLKTNKSFSNGETTEFFDTIQTIIEFIIILIYDCYMYSYYKHNNKKENILDDIDKNLIINDN